MANRSMDGPRLMHGLSRDNPWIVHGIFIDIVLDSIHGLSMHFFEKKIGKSWDES